MNKKMIQNDSKVHWLTRSEYINKTIDYNYSLKKKKKKTII